MAFFLWLFYDKLWKRVLLLIVGLVGGGSYPLASPPIYNISTRSREVAASAVVHDFFDVQSVAKLQSN
jgi:hypothetical protein